MRNLSDALYGLQAAGLNKSGKDEFQVGYVFKKIRKKTVNIYKGADYTSHARYNRDWYNPHLYQPGHKNEYKNI